MRIEVEEALGGTEVRDASLHAGGVAVVVEVGVVVERHPLGEAAGEGRHQHRRVEPQPEPAARAGSLPRRGEGAEEAGWLVVRRETGLELVASASGDEDEGVDLGGAASGGEAHHRQQQSHGKENGFHLLVLSDHVCLLDAANGCLLFYHCIRRTNVRCSFVYLDSFCSLV